MSDPCLQDDELIRLAEGTVSPAESARLRRHLASCETCSAVVAGLSDPLAPTLSPSLAGLSVGPPAVDDGWRPPRTLGSLRIERLLGRGAMGVVYEGLDTVIDRKVAIKFLRAADPKSRERLQAEARAIARLNHPNVVTLFHVDQIDDRPYLIYELVEGRSLDLIDKPVPYPQLLGLAQDLCRGLAEAHRRGVVHRDIKPANAVLTRDGVAKLLDFGLAKLGQGVEVPAAANGSAAAQPGLSQSGAVVGTPRYMAPEAWDGRAPTPRMDVYSMGALLFELATGQPPHDAENLAALALRVVEHPAPALASRAPRLPRAFAALIDRCLDRDPARRPADGGELLAGLQALATPRRARRALFGVGLLGGVAATAGALSLPPRPPRPGTLVHLPAARLQMGSTPDEIEAAQAYCLRTDNQDTCQRSFFEREEPTRAVDLPAFDLDALEVTVEEYAAWLNRQPGLKTAVYGPTKDPYLFQDGTPILALSMAYTPAFGLAQVNGRFEARPGRGRHPITQVTWHGALRYCQARGLRLPTEAEWERAARGAERRNFPWGTHPPRCEETVFARRDQTGWQQSCRERGYDVAPVDALRHDRTPEGVYGLGGNVGEWTMDQFRERYQPCSGVCMDPRWDPPPGDGQALRVYRGGDFGMPGAFTRGAARSRTRQDVGQQNIGFRCAGRR